MKGLMLKDFYALRSYFLRQMGLMAIIFCFVAVSTKTLALLPPMILVSAATMLISSFSADESARWDSYALTLPLSAKQITGAKYLLFTLVIVGAGTVSAALCAGVSELWLGTGAAEIFASAGAVGVMYLLASFVCLPLFIRYGAEKARIYMMLFFMAPFFLIVFMAPALEKRLSRLAVPTGADIVLMAAAAAAVCVVLGLLSYRVAVRFYEQRER